jgi:CRISPR-associated protein Cas2
MDKSPTVVIYDIPNTRIRTKLAEACLDAGLERIQFSAFRGFLTATDRKELACRLKTLLQDGASGRLFVLPLCTEDWKHAVAVERGDASTLAPHKPTGDTILRF